MKTDYNSLKNKIMAPMISAFLALAAISPAFCAPIKTQSTKGAFDLLSIAEVFLNAEVVQKVQTDIKTQQEEEFSNATQKFTQGNIVVAYDEYLSLVMNLKNDFALLNLAKSLYEQGFFTLAELAISKVDKQEVLLSQINDLKSSYEPTVKLSKEEEIYLAKARSSIYFDNCAQEISYDLNKQTVLMEKSDYANYLLAQAMFELRQYQQALKYIENALSKNPENGSYIAYKTKILIFEQNYKEALKYIEKTKITPIFKTELAASKQQALSNLSKDEKKYYLASAQYLEGDFYKVIKTCQALDKKGYKAHAVLGKTYLKLGNFKEAVKNFEISQKLKSNPLALEGLGDIEYLNERWAQSFEYYKKSFAQDDTSTEVALKLALVSKNLNNEKNAQKYAQIAKKLDPNPFFEEHDIATTILAGEKKKEYLRKSLAGNMFYKNNWYEIVEMAVENGKPEGAKNILHITSFSNDTSYKRYYSKALVYNATGNDTEAVSTLKYVVGQNPDFDEAHKLLDRLTGSASENSL